MKSLNPLEKDIEKRVCTHARELGILCYKFTSPARSHVPDRLFILPGGRVFFIEFKRKGQKPTAAQEVEIAKMQKQGVTVYVVDGVERGKYLVNSEFHRVRAKDPLEGY